MTHSSEVSFLKFYTVYQGRIQRGLGGFNPLFSNRRDSIISYNFIRKEKISNAINNCYQVNPLFQKFLDPTLVSLCSSLVGKCHVIYRLVSRVDYRAKQCEATCCEVIDIKTVCKKKNAQVTVFSDIS